MTIKMLAIDFDQTIINGHFHSHCQKQGIASDITPEHGVIVMNDRPVVPTDKGTSKELMDKFLANPLTGPKNQQKLVETLKSAITNGHKIAIVSFTLYPEMIKHTLEYIFKNEENPHTYTEQICIVAGFSSEENVGKEEHIRAAITYFAKKDVKIKRADCLLVDDDGENLSTAEREGYPYTVWVPEGVNPDSEYLDSVLEELTRGRSFSTKEEIEGAFEILSNVEYFSKNGYLRSELELSDSKIEEYQERLSNLKDLIDALNNLQGLSYGIDDISKILDDYNASYRKTKESLRSITFTKCLINSTGGQEIIAWKKRDIIEDEKFCVIKRYKG